MDDVMMVMDDVKDSLRFDLVPSLYAAACCLTCVSCRVVVKEI